MMQPDIYRHRHTFYELPPPSVTHTVDSLRAMLRGKTWEDIVNLNISTFGVSGVHFTARMGLFLRRRAVAVCALNKLLVLRFVDAPPRFSDWTWGSVLDGGNHCGFVLLHSDFHSGRLGGMKLTDPVIGDEGEDGCA